MGKKLLIIAGEASGDLHGSSLIRELKNIDDSIEIWGIGGDKMIAEGMNAIFHINDMAYLGFIEVIKHIPFIRKVKKKLIETVKEQQINNIVLIDYPGFNLSIAKTFNQLALNNIYYISPQIWAWGKGRIRKIKRIINRMIVFFPFEKKLYESNNVHSNFVGHPLAKTIDEYNFVSKMELINKYKLNPDKEILLLLPGSRKQELDKILENVLGAADKISKKLNMQIVIACADNIDQSYFSQFEDKFNYCLIKGDTYNLIRNSKFAIVKSGTSTLETAIIGTPFIVVYKTNYFTYLIGRMLIKIKNIALANIVAEKTVVKELIQDEVNPDNLFIVCNDILSDEKKYENLKGELKIIKSKLKTEGNPSRKAAEIVYAELNAT